MDEKVLDRTRGALFGQACGDALGSTLEFSSAEAAKEAWPNGLREMVGMGPFRLLPGQVTDDTELALALARSIVREGRYQPRKVQQEYRLWAASHPFDIGNATSCALREPFALDATTEANGALMRVSPLGVLLWNTPSTRLRCAMAEVDAAITHPNQVCRAASAIYASTIAELVRGASAAEAFNAARELAKTMAYITVQRDLEDAARGTLCTTTGGHVRYAFRLAFNRLLEAPSVEEAVVSTVMLGGDTDTNGAIVGALVGARDGMSAIPEAWRGAVLRCRPEHRPAMYVPWDLPTLAAQLVEVGR